jgi:DNA-binding MarR family transcriptional regulator
MASDPPAEPLDDSEVLAVAEFRLALRKFEHHTETVVRDCGLTPQRYLLLLTIRAEQTSAGHATVSSIARALRMPQTTVTDLVARAVDVGLLAKADHSADARVVQITVTPEGERRLASAIRRLAADRAELGQSLADASERFV